MIERSEIDQGKSVINKSVILTTQTENRVRDNIDISYATLNPVLLKEEPITETPEIPIWESSKAEIYASSPGLKRFVIWKYDPSEEGVTEYISFNSLDPLSHHYYKTREEYENARRVYLSGGAPDKLIDLNFYDWSLKNASTDTEIVVFSDVKNQSLQSKSKAA